MTKNCIVTVRGEQNYPDGVQDNEPIELITTGYYEMIDGRHTLAYDEVFEDAAGVTSNRIDCVPGSAHVVKNGQINVDMLFEPGKSNLACYTTPFGHIDMAFTASSVECEKTDEAFSLKIVYTMAVEGRYAADCVLELTAKFRPKKK
ncbi:MAG: DUF1934 domain-containing protein [Lachnospiraceae bacterium]|nr:DUF1934 domain-containing protein [Lachnospiraceae bacterium]